MNTTNWQQIVADLREAGLRDADIARIAKTTRQYIGQIGKGDVKNVNYDIGRRLVSMHEASQ